MKISLSSEISIDVAEFLLDTNVISELRKGPRAATSVRAWYDAIDDDAVYLSVLVVGELNRGVERIRRRDEVTAQKLEIWLRGIVDDFADRVLPVTEPIARIWGSFGVCRTRFLRWMGSSRPLQATTASFLPHEMSKTLRPPG